jgi:hypothetical protein
LPLTAKRKQLLLRKRKKQLENNIMAWRALEGRNIDFSFRLPFPGLFSEI